MSGRRVLVYVALVDALAVGTFAAVYPLRVADPWMGTFLLATLVALAGATPVRLPRHTTISTTDPFVFTALAAFGPMPASLVAIAGVLGAALGRDRPREWRHLAFNLGNVVVSTGAASLAYLAVGGVSGTPVSSQVWPLVSAATAYFLVNTGLVTGVVTADTGVAFFATWRASSLWTAVSSYAGLTLSAGLLYLLELAGPSGLALGVPPCWLLAAFYRSHRERQEAQQRRIDQIQEINQALEEKVAERTTELRSALSHIERANTQLRQTNERLTAANRAKDEFLANISHELRTPLNAIIGFSDLVRDPNFGRLNDKQHEFARDIHDSGEHLLRLINDILDLAKIEAGKMELHRQETHVPRALEEAAAMLRPQAAMKSLALEVSAADDARTAMIDAGMYRQVLVNLISNAVKFTPEGGEVRVSTRREGRDLVSVVDDTGIGIAPDDVPKVFREFYQVDGSYARNYGGTGLGLALVKKMVVLHDGSVDIDSTPGQGTRFSVRFPDCLVQEVPATALPEPAEAFVAPGAVAPGSSRETILVVEDNPVNRKLVRNVLRSRGYEVLEAESGEEALRLLEQRTVDLVLMDLQLPGMDGLDITRRLKESPITAAIPVVALTAHARAADEKRALEAGCVGYIAKPIRLADFPSQVGSYLVPAAIG